MTSEAREKPVQFEHGPESTSYKVGESAAPARPESAEQQELLKEYALWCVAKHRSMYDKMCWWNKKAIAAASELARLRKELARCSSSCIAGTTIEELQGETCRLRAERDGLRDALQKLRNEVSAVIGMIPPDDFRAWVGATNSAVLHDRMQLAESALAALPGKETK